MVLLVVKLHDFRADCWFQGVVIVRQLWKSVLSSSYSCKNYRKELFHGHKTQTTPRKHFRWTSRCSQPEARTSLQRDWALTNRLREWRWGVEIHCTQSTYIFQRGIKLSRKRPESGEFLFQFFIFNGNRVETIKTKAVTFATSFWLPTPPSSMLLVRLDPSFSRGI